MDITTLADELEKELSAMHEQQVQKAQARACELRPGLTREDLLNPDNFSDIIADPHYMYEDGQAAGILAAKISVRAYLKQRAIR